ncbi:hypothetical protein ACVBEH_15795 [Roseateles sp. GG27B]
MGGDLQRGGATQRADQLRVGGRIHGLQLNAAAAWLGQFGQNHHIRRIKRSPAQNG